MRPGIDQAWLTALEQAGIQTAILARLDFASETVCVWSGAFSITIPSHVDPLLSGQTFHAVQNGVAASIGENAYSYSGSEQFEMSLSIPDTIPTPLAAASVYPSEYKARPATIWRAVMISSPGIGTPGQWLFKRIRSGQMDTLEVANGASGTSFKLGVEAFAAAATTTTQSSYNDQKRFDPNDRSQDYVSSILNNDPGKVVGSNLVAATAAALGQQFGMNPSKFSPLL